MADPPKAAPKTAEPPKAPDPTTYRFTGAYPANYLLPGRVSGWVDPGEVVDWGESGPPDQHWEHADPPKEAPVGSEKEGADR